MYVAPTPFVLADGTENQITLIVPENFALTLTKELITVGELIRIEAKELIIGYEFDLIKNEIIAKTTSNPSAGKMHKFIACRMKQEPGASVSITS